MSRTRNVAFLSMDSLDEFCCDDDLALPAFADHDLRVDTVSWRSDANWSDYDLVVVRSTWDYFHAPEEFATALARIDSSAATLANTLPVLTWNLDKRYLAELADRGIDIVPTRWGEGLDRAALNTLCERYGDAGFVIKPTISGGSYKTFRLPDEALDVERVVDAHAAGAWMAQPFLPSVQSDGEYSLFFFAGDYSHAVKKTALNGDFRVQEEFGGDIRAIEPSAAQVRAARTALSAVGRDTLYARVDLVPHDGRHLLMEIELIEPSLYLRSDAEAPRRFARACRSWIERYQGL